MNLPIYRLDINEFDEETGIDFVSLVEAPAVERDFQAFNQDFESYTDYPEGAKENAQRGIRLNEENGNKCATQVSKLLTSYLAHLSSAFVTILFIQKKTHNVVFV